MSSTFFKNLTHIIKEGFESVLFTLFANKPWFLKFDMHPAHFAFMPVIGLTFVINAIIDWYNFKKAANKNFEVTIVAIASTLSAIGAVTAISGTLTSQLLGTSFALGPWFFIGALSVGALTNILFLGLNAYRAYNSPENSKQRMHYLQAMASNVISLALITAITASVALVMILPGGPLITAAFATIAVGLTLASLTWRLMPNQWKQGIKHYFGFGKPTEDAIDIATPSNTVQKKITNNIVEFTTSPLFSQGHRVNDVKHLFSEQGCEASKTYLLNTIEQKLRTFHQKSDIKSVSKTALLHHLKNALSKGEQLQAKTKVVKEYPSVFQSALRTTGDIEDIYDAVRLHIDTNDSWKVEHIIGTSVVV
jgi:uncharacterized membrane protein YidH (DUF202 family)